MPDPVFLALQGIILILPAMAANSLAVITGGRGRMDFGKSFIDGRRIFGDGKTWSGFFGGILLAMVFGLIIMGIDSLLGNPFLPYGSGIPDAIYVLLVMTSGSLVGDAAGSFMKRRLGIKSGGNAGLLDQLPFILMSFLFIGLFAWNFFYQAYWNYFAVPVILIITPPVHRIVNVIGFKINRKSVPW